MKQILPITIGVSILILSIMSGFTQATPIESVFRKGSPTKGIIRIDHECQYPLNPSNILSIFLFFEEGIKYITSGDKRCVWHFVKELDATIRNSTFLPNYFQNKFLKNIRKAKKRLDNT